MRSAQRTEFLSDCFVTAFEGGIGYWSQTDNYNHEAGTATLYEIGDEPDESKWPVHSVTFDTIAKGLNRIATGNPESLALNQGYIRDIRKANRLNEWDSNMDAIHGDVILQVGLFGKVIYG